MGIVFGLIAAILLGASDVAAAKVSRTESSIAVTRTALLTSIGVGLVGLLIVPSIWSKRDVFVGSLSGIAMSVGLVMLYRAYALARVGVVAPTTSVLTALIPVLVAYLRGDVPTGVAWAGIALGLAGIGLATYEPPRRIDPTVVPATAGVGGSDRSGLLLGRVRACASGAGFRCWPKPPISPGSFRWSRSEERGWCCCFSSGSDRVARPWPCEPTSALFRSPSACSPESPSVF